MSIHGKMIHNKQPLILIVYAYKKFFLGGDNVMPR